MDYEYLIKCTFFIILHFGAYAVIWENDLEKKKALKFLESVQQIEENCTETRKTFPLAFDYYKWNNLAAIAVRTANLFTKLWIIFSGTPPYLTDEFFYATLTTNLENEDLIFGSQLAFEENVYKNHKKFSPYAFKKDKNRVETFDVSSKYNYSEKEWYSDLKNKTYSLLLKRVKMKETRADEFKRKRYKVPEITIKDGYWSQPYHDCGGGDIWMVTFSAPIFSSYKNSDSLTFSGTSGIDISLKNVDINQCDVDNNDTTNGVMNIFRNTNFCKQSTKCVPIFGMGFRRGSYYCQCKTGFYFPNISATIKAFNGTEIEDYYENLDRDIFVNDNMFHCIPCPKGCETCIDNTPCMYIKNKLLWNIVLALIILILIMITTYALLLWIFNNYKVVKTASPKFLYIMCFGLSLICIKGILFYFSPNPYLCTISLWLHNIGFYLANGSLLLKTWRIAAIFKVTSAKVIRLPDKELVKRLIYIFIPVLMFLIIWTTSGTPTTVITITSLNKKYHICEYKWWEFIHISGRCLFLLWGVYLCFLVRKAPSSFNESTFISIAIYNNIIMSNFLYIIKNFIGKSQGPDLLYILEMLDLQEEVTITACLIVVPKLYLILAGRGNDVSQKPDADHSAAYQSSKNAVKPFSSDTLTYLITEKLQDVDLCDSCRSAISSMKL